MPLKNWSKGTGNKKYRVEVWKNGKKVKTVQFGDKRYEQYQDKTPLKLYTKKNHLDKKRRASYLKRHSKNYPKYSADWFSKKYLW